MLTSALKDCPGVAWAGIYLHGSMATATNGVDSDIDLLLVTANRPAVAQREDLLRRIKAHDQQPANLELSLLEQRSLTPFRHPCPYVFHYASDYRELPLSDLPSDATDPDLAAHIACVHAFGRVLHGQPIESVFPEVPRAALCSSLVADFEWARARLPASAEYLVANAARTLGWVADGELRSKAEGLRDAEEWVLAEHLEAIRDVREARQPSNSDVQRLCDHVIERLY